MSERLETNANVVRRKSHNVALNVSALLEQTLPPSPNLVRQRLDVNVSGEDPRFQMSV